MRAQEHRMRYSPGWLILFGILVLLPTIAVPVLAAQSDPEVADTSQNVSTPHYIYDPKTGGLIGYGTTPSPEEQEIIDQIRGPGYSPFPAPTPLAMNMAPEQPVYANGAPVKITISLSNAIADSFTLSDFPPDLEISIRPDGWNKGIVRTLLHGNAGRVLEAHTTTWTTLTWDQRNDQQVQVNPGVYYLTARANFNQDITPDSTNVLNSNPGFINARSEVIVQYPQGAMTGTLYPNISVTDGEVTATLDSLELSGNRGTVNMTVHAPKPAEGSLSAPGFSQVTAEYYIDNGTAQDFPDYSSLYTGNGVHHVKWQLAPVPCDARKIHIAVTKFDPYRGHWNFTVDCADILYCTVDNNTPFFRQTMLDTLPVKKPATIQPTPLPVILAVAALGCVGTRGIIRKIRYNYAEKDQ
ncbi:MAG: hypothetical protein PHF57_10125 [Methanoregula sp.]|nr:hypothetical protein [Methanoregula sp.]MDD5188548.1 hypothetical protein [Methanoregula sp.]